MRGRSYSYSPPARSYGRSGRSPSPRGRYGGHVDDLPTSLLVRNLRHDCRPEDLRRQFAKFGPVRDIYLPRDYYTREPRGFGFVQFVDPDDAAEAKYEMDGKILLGRELTVVFAEENRKKPAEMRARDRDCWSRSYDRGRSPRYSRSPRHSHSRSRSRSRSPRYSRSRCESSSRSRSPAYHSHRCRRYSRSLPPRDRKSHREWSYSPRDSRSRSRSPTEDDRTKSSYKERRSHYSSPRAGKQQPHRERSASVSQ